MRLHAAADYSNLSDTELDNAYDAVWHQLQNTTGQDRIAVSQTLSDIGSNILDRLSSVWSFTTGAFGYTRFPKYDAIQQTSPQGFVQTTTAQTALKESASNVAGSLKKYAFGGLGLVGLLAGAYILYTITKRK